MISISLLIAAGVKPTQARIFADPLAAACALYDIDTTARIAAFLGQLMVESENFTHLEECLYYTTPEVVRQTFPREVPDLVVAAHLCRNPQALANRVYAGRNGNGNEASGDGWRFIGRGCVAITGRSNYQDAAVELGRPYVEQPELVSKPSDACLTAAWFWWCNKLNVLADSWQIMSITKAVNGSGMRQADLRLQLSERVAKVLV